MRAEIEKLIERLERVTEGTRLLDAQIMKATRSVPEIWKSEDRELIPREDGFASFGKHGASVAAPNYTASIDAALTLVPEGMFWACAPSWDLREHRIYKPYDGGTLQWPEWKGEHKHDAIALCIASLRARLQGDR